jgi:uroporphyrinogen decarboxylase
MHRREAVIAQIEHREVLPMPYTLPYTDAAARKLTDHYGSDDWRGLITNYISTFRAVTNGLPIGEEEVVDLYRTRWRVDGTTRMVVEPAIADLSGVSAYRFPDPAALFPVDSKRAVAAEIAAKGGSFSVAGIGYGIFERSWALRGFEDSLADAATNVKDYSLLLDRITEYEMGLLDLILDLPIDGVYFSDDWGDQRGVMLGAERWRKLIKPRVARLYRKAKEAGKYVLHHTCGNVSEIVPDLIDTGLDVLESLQPEAMDIYRLKREYGKHITFWGGIGSQSILPFGSPGEIRAEVGRMVEVFGNGGGYILSPAKPVLEDTPAENFAALLDAILAYSGHGRPIEGG